MIELRLPACQNLRGLALFRLQAIHTPHIRIAAEEPQAVVEDRHERQIPRRQIDVARRAVFVEAVVARACHRFVEERHVSDMVQQVFRRRDRSMPRNERGIREPRR